MNQAMNRKVPLMGTDVEHWKREFATLSEWEHAVCGIGTKSNPTVTALGNYHVDNVGAELATNVARTPAQLLANYSALRDRMEMAMGMRVQGVDFVDISEVDRMQHGRLWRLARQFGCSPDMVGGQYRRVPGSVKRQTVRELGFHLHFQLPPHICADIYEEIIDDEPRLQERNGRVLEFVDALSHGLDDHHVFAGEQRFEPYFRQAGSYRIKPYGVEYRSLGAGIVEDPTTLADVVQRAYMMLTEYWRTA